MRKLMMSTAAIALAIGAPALAGEGKGNGGGNGGGKARAEASARGNGGGARVQARAQVRQEARQEARQDRRIAARTEARQEARRENRVEARQEARRENRVQARQEARRDARVEARQDARVEARQEARRDARVEARQEARIEARQDARRDARQDARRDARQDARRDARRYVNDWNWVRRDRDRTLIAGCPPGLAKKNNGCLPPGFARKANWRNDRDWDRGWNNYRYRPALFGLSRYDSRYDGRFYYDDGYLMRIGDRGSIAGYIPLLGGALTIGNAWPASYTSYAVPDYYVDYYNLGAPNAYRYADNVIYRVDPGDSAIMSVAALLTGDEFAIGQRMPLGYDVYNVPYAYRDRYYDTPDAMYRYSDGYVYQVDPETMLVAAAIDLVV